MEKCLFLHWVPTECLLEEKTHYPNIQPGQTMQKTLSTLQIRGYILYLYYLSGCSQY